MPWKNSHDFYKVWISEIILQQTQVAQGLPYYERLIKKYPTVQKLAQAKDDDVFKLWEGLGYYSRCSNLLHTARFITKDLKGVFPKNYEDIIKLKGIGSYTAAALSSFVYNLPYAVLDGNVYRVLSRIYGIKTPINTSGGKKVFQTLAQSLLSKKKSREYNQAIMDFGATVCKPANPNCLSCPFSKHCTAYRVNKIHLFPVKKQACVVERYLNYCLIQWQDQYYVQKRTEKDIWKNLYELYPLNNMKKDQFNPTAIRKKINEEGGLSIKVISVSATYKQRLTHQMINCKFVFVKINKLPPKINKHGIWVRASEMKKIAFPKIINSYLETMEH